jgi:hypothetical protein
MSRRIFHFLSSRDDRLPTSPSLKGDIAANHLFQKRLFNFPESGFSAKESAPSCKKTGMKRSFKGRVWHIIPGGRKARPSGTPPVLIYICLI